MYKAENHRVHIQRCAVWREERELRFPYLIGWQKAQNPLAKSLTDWKQQSSHLILELEGLGVLERRAQLAPVGARANRANPNLGCSTRRKVTLNQAG